MHLGFNVLRNSLKLFVCIFACIYNCICPPVLLLSLCLLAKICRSGATSSGLCGAEPVSTKAGSFTILSKTFLWSSIFCALFVKELVGHSCTLGKLANAGSPSRDLLRGWGEAERRRGEMRGSGRKPEAHASLVVGG